MINLNELINSKSVFIAQDGSALTAVELTAKINFFSKKLKAEGLRKIALGLEKPSDFIITFLSALTCGIEVFIPHNTKHATLELLKDNYDKLFLNVDDFVATHDDVLEAKIDTDINIHLFTSGSEGKPKKITKKLKYLLNEVEILDKTFGPADSSRHVISTVSHQHIYGLLFRLLWPLMKGDKIYDFNIRYPEELLSIKESGKAYSLITSPAFLKRAIKIETTISSAIKIYSSGGPLTKELASKILEKFSIYPYEIYGSTETGGIATRQQLIKEQWKVFDTVELSCDKQFYLKVKSDFFEEEYIIPGDLVTIEDDGRFLLKGRKDRTVKIEEKRLSLDEMEFYLKKDKYVVDAACLVLDGENKRKYIAAALVLENNKEFKSKEKVEKNKYFKKLLQTYYDGVLIPKRFRYVDVLPYNEQSKLIKQVVAELFNSDDLQIKFFKNSKLELTLSLNFPPSSVWFDGHFDNFPILPGLAQLDTVINISHKYLGLEFKSYAFSMLKFLKPIPPSKEVMLSLKFNPVKGDLSFSYHDVDKNFYSKGKLSECIQVI